MIKRIIRNIQKLSNKAPSLHYKHALNNIDDKLEKYLNFKNGFFVEAGAYDGVNQSNTYYLEKKKGWNGILIEPIPENFSKITENRDCFSFNCALVSENFKNNHININFAGLMSIAESSLSSKNRSQHISNGLKCHNLENTYKVSVRALTLSDVLKKFNPPSIDFLSLDVEGYENDVLNGIDFSIHKPNYILVEERDHSTTKDFLENVGYLFLEKFSNHDYFYKLM